MKLTTKNGKDLSDYYDHHIQFGKIARRTIKRTGGGSLPTIFKKRYIIFANT